MHLDLLLNALIAFHVMNKLGVDKNNCLQMQLCLTRQNVNLRPLHPFPETTKSDPLFFLDEDGHPRYNKRGLESLESSQKQKQKNNCKIE